MRTLVIAGIALVTGMTATPAGAQHRLSNGQVWQNGHIMPPQPGPAMQPIHQAPPMQQQMHHQRWGGSVGGHWQGGTNAPGGWHAYRRPSRGWIMPHYWISPSFFISDYGTYGLSTPPQGYTWSRYYDDAVLMDRDGRIQDSVSGIDWDSYDSADAYGYGGGGSASAGYGYAEAQGGGGGYGAPYPQPGPGGWSNQPPPYPAQPYPAPPVYAPPPPPPMQGGYTTTYSSSGYAGAGGYISGGYWYPPVTTTTVTVQSAPVVTTTTTEYIETSYAPVRHVYRAVKRKYHPRPRHTCGCGCCR
jgi:Ni/Co efflux regulator RcnB